MESVQRKATNIVAELCEIPYENRFAARELPTEAFSQTRDGRLLLFRTPMRAVDAPAWSSELFGELQ